MSIRVLAGLKTCTVALLATAVVIAGGLPLRAEDQAPRYGGTLVIGADAGPLGLDPQKSASGQTLMVVEHVYSSLLRPDRNDPAHLIGDVADSYQVTSPTVYVFHLRKGVKFHNGRELVADDVRYSIERMLDASTASPWRAIWDIVERVETPDRYTVRLVTKKPFAPLLSYLASPWYSAIVPREVVEQQGDLQRVMAGTGPFVLEKYVPDDVIVLRRNPAYFRRGVPYLDRIEYRIIPSEAARIGALRANSLQYTWSQDPLIQRQLQGVRGITILRPQRPSATIAVWFNQTKPPFSDVRVRRAVSLAIDRKALIGSVLHGQGVVATKIPPSSPFGYRGNGHDLPYYAHDPETARKLLAEAGYPRGFATTLEVASNFPVNVRTAEVMREQLAQVGIQVEIKQMEYGTALTRCVRTEEDGMCIIRHVWQPDPDAYVYQIYYSKSPINLGKWVDPVVDNLLDEGRTTFDRARRIEIYRRLERRVAEMAYTIVPFAFDYAELIRENVRGYISIPGGAPPGTRSRIYLDHAWLR
jgi:peptide/nickel transport system substrate-binding protein